MEFKTVEVVYYVVVWLLAFIAGLSRTIRDNTYERWWNGVAIGFTGGFYGFSVVTILSHYGPSVGSFGWGYIGLAVVIGSLGKEQDKVMRWVFVKAIEKFTGSIYDDKRDNDK